MLREKDFSGIINNIETTSRDSAIIPFKMSKELAEEIGIHVGDGCLRIAKYKFGTKYTYEITSGRDEVEYQIFISSLMERIYNKNRKITYCEDSIKLIYCSKSIALFKKEIGLPVGRKYNVKIPDCVLQSKFVPDFLRGLVDTDGCVMFYDRNKYAPPYPRMTIVNKSQPLILQVNKLLIDMGFSTFMDKDYRKDKRFNNPTLVHRIILYGHANLSKWISNIGFSNPKNLRKIANWTNPQ